MSEVMEKRPGMGAGGAGGAGLNRSDRDRPIFRFPGNTPKNRVYLVCCLSSVVPAYAGLVTALAVSPPGFIPAGAAICIPAAVLLGAAWYGRWLGRYVYSTSRIHAADAVTTAARPKMTANIQPNHGAETR